MTINFRPRGVTIPPPPPKSCRQELAEYASHALTDEKEKEAVVNFINGNEVKSTRRLKGAIAYVYVTTLAIWMHVLVETTAHAEGLTGQEQQTLDMIDGVLFKIQLICGGICVSLATIMAMVAGIFRLLGLREEAKKRYMDAIAGMTMVLTAPVVLGVLATIVRGILKLFPTYAV